MGIIFKVMDKEVVEVEVVIKIKILLIQYLYNIIHNKIKVLMNNNLLVMIKIIQYSNLIAIYNNKMNKIQNKIAIMNNIYKIIKIKNKYCKMKIRKINKMKMISKSILY